MEEKISPLGLDILATNYIPSSKECDLIRNHHIPTHEKRCSALDAQVSFAEIALEALRSEQRTQHALLHAHKVLLTPMRRLIPDLLLEIFRHCHNDFVDVAMRLGRVCRKWRELVLSTPTLWTLVLLQDTVEARRIVPFARACVKYSRSCPIKVVLKFMHRRSYMAQQALFDALALITPHVHRWETFEIYVDNSFGPDDILKAIPSHGQLVERMVLKADRTLPLPFPQLPSLRHLILSVPHSKDVPILLRCTKLRTLSIGGTASSKLTLLDCWTILSNCPDIEVFNIPDIKYEDTDLPTEEITLYRLRDFRIGLAGSDPGPLVSCIKAPRLQRLSLLMRTTTDWSCLTQLVWECRPPLTWLSVTNANGAEVARCIPFLPNLKSLTLQQTESTDAVIISLTEQDIDGALRCPNLDHFSLRLCLFSAKYLLRLAKERRRATGGLRIVSEEDAAYRRRSFVGFTIELSSIYLTDSQKNELRGMQKHSAS